MILDNKSTSQVYRMLQTKEGTDKLKEALKNMGMKEEAKILKTLKLMKKAFSFLGD